MLERLTAALTVAGLLAGAGCGIVGGRGERASGEGTRRVTPEAFAGVPGGGAGATGGQGEAEVAGERNDPRGATDTGTPPSPRMSDRARDGDPARAFGAEPVVVRGVTPVATPPDSSAPSAAGLELVDAKVGDINGRPIFVSSFFEPIEARLVAEAARLDRNAWRRLAAEEIIVPRLDGLIADELLRAEALAALSPAQRQGLRSFLTSFRRDLVSENLGSEQLARRRLEEGSGRSLDDTLRDKETDTLIRLALAQQINRRINVSWRDIRQRYERDQNIYNPPPTARFRMIRVPTDRAEDVARINERLAAGEAFAEVAKDPANGYERDLGGLYERAFTGDFSRGEFFGAPVLNERARALSPGGASGAFEVGSSTTWLWLEGIERTSTSLYEAQLRISQELTLERRRREQEAYLGRLIERARVSNRDEMLLRLLAIAEERYGPRG
jgi:hypothetical protein